MVPYGVGFFKDDPRICHEDTKSYVGGEEHLHGCVVPNLKCCIKSHSSLSSEKTFSEDVQIMTCMSNYFRNKYTHVLINNLLLLP